jgi:uncharacterized protein
MKMAPSPGVASAAPVAPSPNARPAPTRRWSAFLALALLVPIPTLGTWFGLYFPETRGTGLGQAIYFGAKIWILLLPLGWLLIRERKKLSLSPMQQGGWTAGIFSGIGISLLILLGWLLVGRQMIDPATMRATATTAGIGSPGSYLLFALYLCTLNALLEEYVWRWFVYSRCEDLLGRLRGAAVLLSALFFTAHHVIALLAQLPGLPALLASAGVFIGGCTWSVLYLRYRSIWPGFVSHVIIDIAILLIGASILFGGA